MHGWPGPCTGRIAVEHVVYNNQKREGSNDIERIEYQEGSPGYLPKLFNAKRLKRSREYVLDARDHAACTDGNKIIAIEGGFALDEDGRNQGKKGAGNGHPDG